MYYSMTSIACLGQPNYREHLGFTRTAATLLTRRMHHTTATHTSFQSRCVLQVVNGEMYVVGETLPFQSRHQSVKKHLLELARMNGRLPDVDIYFASEDLPEAPRLTGSEACRSGRRLLSQPGILVMHCPFSCLEMML